jgi:proteic killer suppression protein
VITSFRHKGLERFYRTGSLLGIQAVHAERLRLILSLLDAATTVNDLNAPALRLHRLKGEIRDIWAVTVQANWRVTFRFVSGNAEVVNYEDYH